VLGAPRAGAGGLPVCWEPPQLGPGGCPCAGSPQSQGRGAARVLGAPAAGAGGLSACWEPAVGSMGARRDARSPPGGRGTGTRSPQGAGSCSVGRSASSVAGSLVRPPRGCQPGPGVRVWGAPPHNGQQCPSLGALRLSHSDHGLGPWTRRSSPWLPLTQADVARRGMDGARRQTGVILVVVRAEGQLVTWEAAVLP